MTIAWTKVAAGLSVCVLGHGLFAAEAKGPLRVHPENPRYFTDGSGRAVYLTGSHVWNNWQDQGIKGDAVLLLQAR